MIKDIKLKVKTDEENQYVLKKLIDVNKKFAWYVTLPYGNDLYDLRGTDFGRSVCSLWKGFRHVVIDEDGDLILCVFEKHYNNREEEEITFQQFKEMVENEGNEKKDRVH